MTPTDTDRRLAEILGRLQATPPHITLERHGDGFAFFSMRDQPIDPTKPPSFWNVQHGWQIAYGGVYDSRMWPPLRDLLANAQGDIAFLLSLVEGLSRELLEAKAPSVIRGALADVIAERAAQDRKWGEQNHRDACPALLDRDGGVSAQRLADDLEIPSAARARANCQAEFARGQGNWGSILVEEVAEAVAAIGEDADLRRELVQVSAVSLAWIEAIDRRSVGAPLVAAKASLPAQAAANLTNLVGLVREVMDDTGAEALGVVSDGGQMLSRWSARPFLADLESLLTSVGAPLGAAPALSAEGSIPSLPCPSPPSSPVPPAAPTGSAPASLSCTPTGSEGGHGRTRPCPDCGDGRSMVGRDERHGCTTCGGARFVGVP